MDEQQQPQAENGQETARQPARDQQRGAQQAQPARQAQAPKTQQAQRSKQVAGTQDGAQAPAGPRAQRPTQQPASQQPRKAQAAAQQGQNKAQPAQNRNAQTQQARPSQQARSGQRPAVRQPQKGQAARSGTAKQPSMEQRQAQAQARRQTQTQRMQQAKQKSQTKSVDQAQRAQQRKKTQQPRRSNGQGISIPALSEGKSLFGQGMSRTTLIAAIAAIAVAAIAWFATGGFGLNNAPDTPPEEQIEQTAATPEDRVEQALSALSIEQKIAQMFLVTPEELTGADVVVAAGDVTRLAISDRPVGGIIYSDPNLQDPEQTREMLASTQQFSQDSCGLPMFIGVDEEGGDVIRVASNEAFGVEDVGPASNLTSTSEARDAAYQIGSYLRPLGFNTDFAPVADIASSEYSTMATRSFGSTASEVAPMVEAQIQGFTDAGIVSCAKHFPGIGAAEGDSHYESITTSRTAEDMQNEEFVPFQSAIKAGVPMIMVGHISAPELTGDNTPASLSKAVITDNLRNKLGFEGIIITDSFSMASVTDLYSSEEAAVAAIQAGVDIVLMPLDFDAAYRGVVDAVKSGQISEERINESVRRIIKAKQVMQEATPVAAPSSSSSQESTSDDASSADGTDSTDGTSSTGNSTSSDAGTADTTGAETVESMEDMNGNSVQISQAEPSQSNATGSYDNSGQSSGQTSNSQSGNGQGTAQTNQGNTSTYNQYDEAA